MSTARFPLVLSILAALTFLVGCQSRHGLREAPTPVSAGLNTRDLVDLPAQVEADTLGDTTEIARLAEEVRRQRGAAAAGHTPRNILCLSGGGSFGAYSAGVLVGMTQCGTRPQFDVVTGISTGALIAPFAFLGPHYDEEMKRFFTMLESRDIFRLQAVRGLLSESLASNAPLARQVEETLTPRMMAELACEHQKGRRLYVGTTEMEGRRFIVWDIGAIACNGDRELIKRVLLGSSAIPGFFPPSEIPVNVDGQILIEKHVDGSVSQALFFRPPYLPPEQRHNLASDLAGANVYAIIAGKLYTDPEVITPRALRIAGKSISTILAAQTRGDLQRMYTVCMLTGMNFHLTAIPTEYNAPVDSTDFDPKLTTGMFDEGVRQVCQGTAWRKTPPGVDPGESVQARAGTCLTRIPRGPPTPVHQAKRVFGLPRSDRGIPVPPTPIDR